MLLFEQKSIHSLHIKGRAKSTNYPNIFWLQFPALHYTKNCTSTLFTSIPGFYFKHTYVQLCWKYSFKKGFKSIWKMYLLQIVQKFVHGNHIDAHTKRTCSTDSQVPQLEHSNSCDLSLFSMATQLTNTVQGATWTVLLYTL